MKLLLDTCVAGSVREAMQRDGHDVVWAAEWAQDPGDHEILARAHAEGRILVTIDKDFGELAIVRGQQHHGILRLAGLSSSRQPDVCRIVLSRHAKELHGCAIVTADGVRIRVRPGGADST
jgi:predicted nuclease of predicted toxin-antitoxin system